MEDIVLDIYQASIVAQALIESESSEEINDILSRLERHIDGLKPITVSLSDDEVRTIKRSLDEFRDHSRGHAVDETLKTIEYHSSTYGKTTA